MKNEHNSSAKFQILAALSCCLLLLMGLGATVKNSPKGLVAHEWGTFTSVQGGDGRLLSWRPLESSRLPGFVYDWRKPGLDRQASSYQALGKGSMQTLQRMETPVIYFYSDEERSVDVSVGFPKGLITEWYPQAEQIGPSLPVASPTVAKLDDLAHKAGAKPAFSFTSLMHSTATKDSRARWSHIDILPAKQNATLSSAMPADKSGSHYFSARETESDFLRVNSLVPTNPLPELEKFIFYRGVGNFDTPLSVTANSSGELTLSNVGKEPLKHLFLLSFKDRRGNFIRLERLAAGQSHSQNVEGFGPALNLETVSKQIAEQMARALTNEGLYPAEAAAMVKTWQDSWFAEDGVRVLYVLPRAWTDQTLPLTIEPAPRETVRVMVGRAEVLTPTSVRTLSESFTKASEGDEQARQNAVVQLKTLGRFAEPALSLAIKDAPSRVTKVAWKLFQLANSPAPEAKVALASFHD